VRHVNNLSFFDKRSIGSFLTDFLAETVPNCHQRIQNAEKPWRKEVFGRAIGRSLSSGATRQEARESIPHSKMLMLSEKMETPTSDAPPVGSEIDKT
jgi:hypothetical protein